VGKNASFLTEAAKMSGSSPNVHGGRFKPKSPAADARQTVFFERPPYILSGAAVVTEREAEGPIGRFFDTVSPDAKFGQKTYENAEIRMVHDTVQIAADKAGLKVSDIDMLLAGDLLNQITTSTYAARDLGLPLLGLYSACSTMSQSLAVGACMLNAGYFKRVACATASHFATAERQYRYPLEYGSQRPPFAQWTVTGAGCTLLGAQGTGPRITAAVFGKVVDFGVTDIANMGAAMAPANAIIDP
jgi:stage V sporulation protein AD